MPLSIKTAEEALHVRPSIAQFVIPLGATINMTGTALYQGVAAMFLAQVYGIDIGLGGMLLVVAMAVGAAVGSPGTPGVGIVILAMVLTTVGIPAEGVALIMGVRPDSRHEPDLSERGRRRGGRPPHGTLGGHGAGKPRPPFQQHERRVRQRPDKRHRPDRYGRAHR